MKGGKMDKQKNTAIIVTSIISGVILITAIITLLFVNSAIGVKGNAVTVEGIATIEAMPDQVVVYFNIETTGDTSNEAREANSEILNDLILGLAGLGIPQAEIITENYNIYPNYDWDNGKRIEKGYRATHSVKVTVDPEQTELIADVVDAGALAGAGISYINFELTQESQNKYKAEAMKLAAQDAKIKAEAIAEGFGKKVGRLISTSVSDFGYYPWNIYSSRDEEGSGAGEIAVAKQAVSNIQPGEKEITSRITASFKIN